MEHGLLVEGRAVKDIQLDAGYSRTVVRSDLIDKKILDGKFITIQCTHGDTVSYPLAQATGGRKTCHSGGSCARYCLAWNRYPGNVGVA